MNREEAVKKIREQRLREAQEEKEKFQKSADKFNKLPAKIIRYASYLIIALGSLYLIDGFLPTKTKTYKIHGAESYLYRYYTADGGLVHPTFYLVQLKEGDRFNIMMYKYEYYLASVKGEVNVRLSPIFNNPSSISVGPDNDRFVRPVDVDQQVTIFLPIMCIVFGLMGAFINFGATQQTLIFGYISLIIVPLLTVFMTYVAFTSLTPNGEYEIDKYTVQLIMPDLEKELLQNAPEGTEDGSAWH